MPPFSSPWTESENSRVCLPSSGTLWSVSFDHEDVVAVAGVALLVGADPVGARADRVLRAVVLRERRDRDPAGVQLGEVLEAVLVLAEAGGRVGEVLDVVDASS